jgi:hypothetical protein
VNPSELDEVVIRANSTLKAQFSGFSGCTVKSYSPPIVEYFFTDHISANAFCFNRELLDRKVRMATSDTTVLEEW